MDVVQPEEDPTALHPEIQQQLPHIRTDLDRFSPLEISCLIRQGYCVGRKVCRARPDLFGADLPANAPWDPFPESHATSATPTHSLRSASLRSAEKVGVTSEVTTEARALQRSTVRRIWGNLLDYRDWVSYIYVPILLPILTLMPYFIYTSYQRSHRINQIIESLAQSSRDLEQMTVLIDGPVAPWTGETAEDLVGDQRPDNTGFMILQDSRMIDLRKWKPKTAIDSQSYLYGYRRLKVLKQDEQASDTFRISVLATSSKTQVRFPPQLLRPSLHSHRAEADENGEKQVHWEVQADLKRVPPGESVDIIYEHLSPGLFIREGNGVATLAFDVEVETVELIRWLLLPEGKQFHDYRLIRYETGKPETTERVDIVTRYLASDYSILAFKLLALKPGYTYELTWYYR
jgi:hypothetical protein